MKVEYHPAVQGDFNEAIDRYDAIEPRLADRFETEFRQCVAAVKASPRRFPFFRGSEVFCRVRLRSFPYVIVYREKPEVVRVTILRHEKRHPLYGMRRR